jgi:hypothetical protein
MALQDPSVARMAISSNATTTRKARSESSFLTHQAKAVCSGMGEYIPQLA